MDKFSEYMSTANVSLKTLTSLVLIISGAVLFYFQGDSHMSNEDLHTSHEEMLEVHDNAQKLRDRIEILEWELRQLMELTTRRHNNQRADIESFNGQIGQYENKLVEIRKILFEAFIKEITDNNSPTK